MGMFETFLLWDIWYLYKSREWSTMNFHVLISSFDNHKLMANLALFIISTTPWLHESLTFLDEYLQFSLKDIWHPEENIYNVFVKERIFSIYKELLQINKRKTIKTFTKNTNMSFSNSNMSILPGLTVIKMILKVWYLGQQPQHDLGIYKEGEFRVSLQKYWIGSSGLRGFY